MSNCKICKRFVGSVSVTVVGTSLVINIPQANYDNCERLCLAILQEIPATATRGMPVVITIGDGTTQYPLVRCNGTPVTQEYIGQNNIYPLKVQTTSTSAVFRVLNNLCAVSTSLPSIPVVTTPAEGG
jgi:hypothetical protein